MKNYKSTVYYCPTVTVITMNSEGVICASSGELDDLQKNPFDFDWEN